MPDGSQLDCPISPGAPLRAYLQAIMARPPATHPRSVQAIVASTRSPAFLSVWGEQELLRQGGFSLHMIFTGPESRRDINILSPVLAEALGENTIRNNIRIAPFTDVSKPAEQLIVSRHGVWALSPTQSKGIKAADLRLLPDLDLIQMASQVFLRSWRAASPLIGLPQDLISRGVRDSPPQKQRRGR